MFATRTFSMVRFSFVALAALALSPMLANSAHASYVASITYSNNLEPVTISYNGNQENVLAGAFQTTLLNANDTPVAPTFNTYCVDIFHELKSSETFNLNAITTLAGGNGAYVGSLYANFAAGATSYVQQAGLQLAIWETEYDGPNVTDPSAGPFTVVSASQDVINQAIFYYENNKLVSLNNVSYLQDTTDNPGQSLVGPNAVPEPASVAMLGMGLVAAAGHSIRRRRSIAG